MDITIQPGFLEGKITVIPSKSQAHRYLICAAFADGPTRLLCPETNRDMDATADCLRALGAEIVKNDWGYSVAPVSAVPRDAELYCRDSGSTLRFLLPVAGALGVKAAFHLEGRLPSRPLSPMWEEMERMGCRLSRPTETTILTEGKLRPGTYQVDGGVSSQFITGLLFGTSLISGSSRLLITGTVQSKPYIDMTLKAMEVFGRKIRDFQISGGEYFHSPGTLSVEGDWSNGAFFLAANSLGSHLQIEGLDPCSCQGDRAAAHLLENLSGCPTISGADIPDLVPILSVAAACRDGAVFTDIGRLRLKESDRVQSVTDMICALGGKARATAQTLEIFGTGLTGGTVDADNDHRIAMSAAIAATVCRQPVTILGAQCVCKSYPGFWEEYRRLGGNYEQYIR